MGGAVVGRRGGGDYSGILIPYFLPGSEQVRDYRLRRDRPDLEYDAAGSLKAKRKYLSPPGRSNMLHLPPGVSQSLLNDPMLPIVITEGEFKTLAVWRAAHHRASSRPRFLPLGVSGIYNWQGMIGKTFGPDGSGMDVEGAIPDLDWIFWAGRRVVIVYGADAVTKKLVRIARSALAAHLRGRGALVGFLEWDIDRGKGIDDHLAAVGADAVLDEIAHVDFAGSAWKKDLLRSKPPMNTTEGRILPVLANAIAAFRHAPEWAGVLAFNEFGFGTVVLKPAPWGVVPNGEWTDHEDRLAAEWLQRQGILVSVDVARQAVQTAARDHPFHPVKTYLHSLLWDGVQRLDRWLSTYLGAEDTEYSRAIGSRWLISAVARIFQPGAKADCCLILEGPQGIRKSTALRTIAGEYFTDELADLGSKDAAMQTRGVWIIELSELDNLSHAEVARIKAFMSRATGRFRPPYGMRLVESPRQCVFAGTVNHGTYLRDETGGRRFWPVVCGRVDVDGLSEVRDQLWAEAKARYKSGCPWWLDTPDLVQLASDQQEARYEGDPWEEVIGPWLESKQSTAISEVLQRCIDKPQAQWTQTDKIRAARCLRAQGWVRYRERQGNRLEWRYRRVV
jgi:predicted P-loop ATPase